MHAGWDPALAEKYRALREALGRLRRVVVAFSGGVDSAFLAAVARDVLGRENAVAAASLSPSLAGREARDIRTLAALGDLLLHEFSGTEYDNPLYRANGPDRCYFCKEDLFHHLEDFAKKSDFDHILYGANRDDEGDYRPGQRAAREKGVKAPLADLGWTKAEIRAASRLLGLPTFEKPASPCLSSRIPYGQAVTREKLSAIDAGEEALREMGFSELRLRHDGDTARIEVPLAESGLFANAAETQRLVERLKGLGFKRILLDLEGFRSGSLNRDLPFG